MVAGRAPPAYLLALMGHPPPPPAVPSCLQEPGAHLGQRPRSVLGTGSCRWVLASPVLPATSLPVLGRALEGLRGALGLGGLGSNGLFSQAVRRGSVNRQTLSLLPGPGAGILAGRRGKARQRKEMKSLTRKTMAKGGARAGLPRRDMPGPRV